MNKKYIFIICGMLAACLLTAAFDVRLRKVTYTVKSLKITDDVKLALVTDLHSCSYGKNQSKLLDEIEKYKPDAVLLGGDIFDDVLDDANACMFVDEVAKKYKTYYVSGNHEWWSNRMEELFEYLVSRGVIVLRGNSDVLNTGKDKIAVFGIDDPEVDAYNSGFINWEEQLQQAGEKTDETCFNLLLTHRPECANQYFKYEFDAVLSGHAHGGQFRIPFILNGIYSPNQGVLPKLAGGIYDFNGKKMIVSRGLARESTRIPRIFNRPELVFVNLVPQK